MSQFGLLKVTAEALDRLHIPFMISGSHASSLQGEPRMTHDIDVVVDVSGDQVDALLAEFPSPAYYASREAVDQAVAMRGMFNVIDLSSTFALFWC
jgi:hypothetical protein